MNSTSAASEGSAECRKITLTRNGPALIEGPVELVTGDGTSVYSDRFLVAMCTCRRSKNFPLCDASHRRRRRSKPQKD
ncbi:CDGSH iron-sulfur domain-containing protein [Nocardia sp. NPDC057440]|uniref:CDGSH iron-sulfur domain-containing protein n=1 Tax=Nocardia sp. NPDC057440 TaxID=3346134 RepID=UPI00366BF61B